MCGISGLRTTFFSKEITQKKVTTMVFSQRHRGPDDEGVSTFYDGEETIVFGHNRLSIIDVTKDGHQPMVDKTNGNTIVFNGEIYNYKVLRRELEGLGHIFCSRTDTEVILKVFSEWGVDGISRLRGIFSFAILSKKDKKLILARDQMGVKPLYYYKNDHSLYFASEVRALLKGGVPAKLSNKGLCSQLLYGSVQEPFTLIEGIYSLACGTYAVVDEKFNMSFTKYWNPYFNNFVATDAEEIQSETTRLLAEVIKSQLVSDVPLGTFLSGGIDSSAIVAIMRRACPDVDIRTFSIVFDDVKYDERQYARLVADRNHTNHTELLMTGKMVQDYLSQMLFSYDQPSVDGMNSWFVSKLVKENGITVALSGVGGDELFVGYGDFRKPRQIYKMSLIRKILPSFLGSMIEKISISEKTRKVGQLLAYDYDPYFISRRVFSNNQYESLINEDYYTDPYNWIHESYDEIVNMNYVDEISKISWYEQRSYMLSTLLRDTDQMSMAHSLEIRVPLIDHKLVEFITSIPSLYKVNNHTTKDLLVRAAGDGIPEECIFRPKQGFSFPFDSYIKNELYSQIESFYMGDSLSFFQKDALRRLWMAYKRGHLSWARVLLPYITNMWLKNWNISF